MGPLTDRRYLRDSQYRETANLVARSNLHERYGRGDWFRWIASQAPWPDHGLVLEVGCGTGYASAILSKLGSSVVALESDAELAASATETLASLGYDNVAVVTGDLEGGYAPEAPYDAVFVHGAVEFVPEALFAQLRDGGRLVVVEGYGNASQARLYIKEGGRVAERKAFNTAVKPLPGFRKAKEFVF